MRVIDQINRDIKKTRGLSLRKVCIDAGVNYQTVWRALKQGKDIKESTLLKLSDQIEKSWGFASVIEENR
jgi:hypothetical protein